MYENIKKFVSTTLSSQCLEKIYNVFRIQMAVVELALNGSEP